MPKPFRGVVNVDIRDSVPDWEPFLQPKAPEDAPNVLMIVWDDVGLRRDGRLRRPDRDAHDAAHRGCRPPLFQLPHHGSLLAHAIEPAHGAQRHEQQHGLHHGGLGRLPGVLGTDPLRERHHRRGAERAGLEHVRDRQVAPHARGRGGHVGVEGPLAARPRVRAVLRLPRRRDEPVVSGPRLRQPHDRAARGSRGRLPPLEGPDRQGDRVRARLEGGGTREALVHVLLPGLRPRAPPRVQGVVGQVRRPLRRGLRGHPRDDPREPEEARAAARRRRAVADQPARRA